MTLINRGDGTTNEFENPDSEGHQYFNDTIIYRYINHKRPISSFHIQRHYHQKPLPDDNDPGSSPDVHAYNYLSCIQ